MTNGVQPPIAPMLAKVSEDLPQDRYAYYVSEAMAGLDDLRQAQMSEP